MKILFYINSISHGGAERVLVNLANQFSENGNEVYLVTSLKKQWEYPVGKKVSRVSLEGEDYTKAGFLQQNIKWTKKLREIIKEKRPDIVISFMAEPNFRAILATIGLKSKCMVSVRNDPDKEYPNAVYRILAKILYLFADGIVFQTEDAKKCFSASIQKKSQIIYNQVDQKFYDYPTCDEKKDIVTCGRLVEQKNQEMLINAFARIAEDVSENLYVYGEGKLREKLENRIREMQLEDRIYLPGNITNVEEMLSKAALFVLPSDYEGMPNALMEAMAMGVPCISTNCPCGGPLMLFENNTEALVSVGNAEELADKMKYFLSNKEKCKEIGAKMKAYSLAFTPERIFKKWDEYVNAVLKNK